MSHEDYENQITQQNERLNHAFTQDATLNSEILNEQDKSKDPNYIECREKMINSIGTRYLEYLEIYKNLNNITNNVVQPEKSKILRKLLNCVIGRVLELKSDMVNVDGSDYHFLSKILIDKKMTPFDVDVPAPILSHDKFKNPKSIQNKIRRIIGTDEALTANYDARYYNAVQCTFIEKPQLSVLDAIRIIQKSERARQGRLRFHLMKQMGKMEAFRSWRENAVKSKSLDPNELIETATLCFQRIWRGRQAMKTAKIERTSELEFVGCILSNAQENLFREMEGNMINITENRVAMRLNNENEMLNALMTLGTELRENELDTMKTLMSDTMREWYLSEYETNQKLPEFPESGTEFLFNPAMLDSENGSEKLANDKSQAKEDDPEDTRVKVLKSAFTERISTAKDEYLGFPNKVKNQHIKERKIQEHSILWKKVEYEKKKRELEEREEILKRAEDPSLSHGVTFGYNDNNSFRKDYTKDYNIRHDEPEVDNNVPKNYSNCATSRETAHNLAYNQHISYFKKFNTENQDHVDLEIQAENSKQLLDDLKNLTRNGLSNNGRRATIWPVKETDSGEEIAISRATLMKMQVKAENDVKYHPSACGKKVLEGNKFDKPMLRNKLRDDMERKMREEVEKVMQLELQQLQAILDSKAKKAKKGGKNKGAKGKKGKKDKDPTANRTMDSLEDELIANGIMTIPPKHQFREIVGLHHLMPDMPNPYADPNLNDEAAHNPKAKPKACHDAGINDLKNLLILYGVMPLYDETIMEHLTGPTRTRSLLLAGPMGMGKKSLAYCIAHESQSVFFDLSSDNLVGKYQGKGGTAMLLHMVFKVAKFHQPAVVFMNNADIMLYKKIPKEMQAFEPKRLKKDWPKIIKKFPCSDRILVIGTANDVATADVKALNKIWDKVLLIPMPDYGARILIWEYAVKILLSNFKNPLDQLENGVTDLAALSKMTENYTPGMIWVIAKETIMAYESVLKVRKIKINDFLMNMARLQPLDKDAVENLKEWYGKVALGKKFVQIRKRAEE